MQQWYACAHQAGRMPHDEMPKGKFRHLIALRRFLTYFFLLGSLCPFAAKAFPNAFLGPPPAGFTWQRPHASPVWEAYCGVALAGRGAIQNTAPNSTAPKIAAKAQASLHFESKPADCVCISISMLLCRPTTRDSADGQNVCSSLAREVIAKTEIRCGTVLRLSSKSTETNRLADCDIVALHRHQCSAQ